MPFRKSAYVRRRGSDASADVPQPLRPRGLCGPISSTDRHEPKIRSSRLGNTKYA